MKKLLCIVAILLLVFVGNSDEPLNREVSNAFLRLTVSQYSYIGTKVPKEAQIPFVVTALDLNGKFTPISEESYGMDNIYLGRLNEDHLVDAFNDQVQGYYPVEGVWEGRNCEGPCLVIKANHFVFTWQRIENGPLYGACRFLLRFINLTDENTDSMFVYMVK